MKKPSKKTIICFAIIIACVAVAFAAQWYINVSVPAQLAEIKEEQAEIRNTYTVTITKAFPVPRSEEPGYFYLVYAYDLDACIFRTFEMDDWAERQNTSDWFGAIEVGETYTIEVLGERRPPVSEYPNIIWIEGLYTRDDGRLTDMLWN